MSKTTQEPKAEVIAATNNNTSIDHQELKSKIIAAIDSDPFIQSRTYDAGQLAERLTAGIESIFESLLSPLPTSTRKRAGRPPKKAAIAA